MLIRCGWSIGDPLYEEYHDNEWGVPVFDDQKLFEMLVLEGMQAGLSWITILRKREAYREAFANFDPSLIAKFSDRKLEMQLDNPGIIRNRLKVYSIRNNAKIFLEVQEEYGSFREYIWQFVGSKQKSNAWHALSDVPAKTKVSDEMAKQLQKRGFKFVGSTICYAFMQAVGMVNDHLVSCFRHSECDRLPTEAQN